MTLKTLCLGEDETENDLKPLQIGSVMVRISYIAIWDLQM